VRILDLAASAPEVHDAVAALLSDPQAWDQGPLGWDADGARAEVAAALTPGRIARVALGDGEVLGFAGAIDQYDGHAWELHPLVVAPAARGTGLGATLLADIEGTVAGRGGCTLHLGTDDQSHTTTVADRDLYGDVPGAIAGLATRPGAPRHPFEFYRRCGYTVVGLIPDANGPGLPDILMAKRLAPAEADRVR